MENVILNQMTFVDFSLKSNYIFIDSLNSLIIVFRSGNC